MSSFFMISPHLWFKFFIFGVLPNILCYITYVHYDARQEHGCECLS